MTKIGFKVWNAGFQIRYSNCKSNMIVVNKISILDLEFNQELNKVGLLEAVALIGQYWKFTHCHIGIIWQDVRQKQEAPWPELAILDWLGSFWFLISVVLWSISPLIGCQIKINSFDSWGLNRSNSIWFLSSVLISIPWLWLAVEQWRKHLRAPRGQNTWSNLQYPWVKDVEVAW